MNDLYACINLLAMHIPLAHCLPNKPTKRTSKNDHALECLQGSLFYETGRKMGKMGWYVASGKHK